MVGTISPTNQSGSNRIMGTVKLTPTSSGYRAEVAIRNGGGSQNKYPWIIRPGVCGTSIGDILGNELSYKILETSADGSARIVAPLNIVIPPAPSYHVDILRSQQDRQTIVACADLAVQ
jgi:hypothetical protein